MPFSRPTLTDLIQQAQTDVAYELDTPALLRFSPENAYAVAFAGLASGLYGYLDWIARQATPFTAEDEYLEAWAALAGVSRKLPVPGAGPASFSGTAGAALPIGTQMRSATGQVFVVTAGGTVGGGSTVSVTAEAADAGAAGNLPSGAILTLSSAVPGILATGSATAAFAGGADLENDDRLRTRMLQAFAETPQGGAASDYVIWALEVPGVTRAWVNPNGAGAGSVVVYIMLDDVRAGGGGFPVGDDGTATSETRGGGTATGDLLLAANYIYPRRPGTALVYLAAPTAAPIDITINDLNDSSLRPVVAQAIADMLLDRAAVAGTIYPSDLTEAIKSAPGVTRFSMPVPDAPVVAVMGDLPTLGTITWG